MDILLQYTQILLPHSVHDIKLINSLIFFGIFTTAALDILTGKIIVALLGHRHYNNLEALGGARIKYYETAQ